MKSDIAKNCGQLLYQGYHCSESMLLGVGSILTPIHPQVIKVATGFAGGIGSTKDDLCGALTGGIMVIGLLYGRTDPKTNDDECQRLCALYRQRFMAMFGCINCHEVRTEWEDKPHEERQACCAQVVEEAAEILLEVLKR